MVFMDTINCCFGCRVLCHLIFNLYSSRSGHTVANWLRHYATSRKVAGSILGGVIF
jgi:hypothetical protein